jgi:signal transduction histidine kinase
MTKRPADALQQCILDVLKYIGFLLKSLLSKKLLEPARRATAGGWPLGQKDRIIAVMRRLHEWSKPALLGLTWSGLLGIGVIDYLTTYEVSLSVLYLPPIALAAWEVGFHWGIATAGVGLGVWLAADIAAVPSYSHSLIPFWNAIVRSGIFMGTAVVLTRLRNEIIEREQAEAALQQAHAALEDRVRARTAELEAAQERLQTLSRQLLEAQETEQRRLARELHDEMGQLLTGLTFLLDASRDLPPAAFASALQEAQTLANELLTRVRELSLTLRPPLLDDLGLLPALLWYAERYTIRVGIPVLVRHSGVEGRFPALIETTVYRIVQEALTNVARHAHTNAVTLELWADAETVGLRVTDGGVGFNPQARLTDPTTSGLVGMYERAHLAGGRLTLDAVPGTGTRVMAEFPLPMEREGELQDEPDNSGAGR